MFLKSKYVIPDAPFVFIHRENIHAQLIRSSSFPLINLVAPAGYGKSATALSYLQLMPGKHGWFSVSAGDNSPENFWRYLTLAFHEIDQEYTLSCYKMALDVSPSGINDLIHRLLADLENLAAKQAHTCLVLDDFHHIENEIILSGFSQFLDLLPKSIQIIITSRTHPPLDLSRRRSKQKLLEITSRQLAFNADETRLLFLKLLDCEIDHRTLTKWLKQTEGWITGIHLIGLQILHAGTVDIDGMQYIDDYMWETVIDQLDDDLKRFLKVTAYFPRFSAELCDAMLERDDSREVLLKLYRGGFFIIPLDSKNQWFRYHDLFKSALKSHGDPVDELLMYRQKAAQWFEKQNLFAELCEQFSYLKDWQWITKVAESMANAANNYANISLLSDLLNEIPYEIVQDRPKCLIIKARSILSRGRYQEAPKILARAKEIMEQNDYLIKDPASWKAWASEHSIDGHEQWDCLYGQLLMDQSVLWRAFGQAHTAKKLLEEAQQRIPDTAQQLLPRLYAGLALLHFEMGLEEQAQHLFEEAIRVSRQAENLEILAQCLIFFGHLMLFRGKFKECLRYLHSIFEWLESKGFDVLTAYQLARCAVMDVNKELHISDAALEPAQRFVQNRQFFAENATYCMHQMVLYQNLYRSCIALKEYEKAETMVNAFEDAQKKSGTQWNSPGCPSAQGMRANLAFLKGESVIPVHWAKEVLTQHANTQSFQSIMDRFIAVKIMVHLQDVELRLNDIYKLKKEAVSQERVYFLLKICLYEALFHYKKDQISQAKAAMTEALEIAEAYGFYTSILEEGDTLVPLIIWNIKRSPTYCGTLLKGFGVDINPHSSDNAVDTGLSKKEIKLLSLLNSGLRYRDIADQLNVSLSTVKFHVNNIFKKLQVGSRTEAVVRARELKFLA